MVPDFSHNKGNCVQFTKLCSDEFHPLRHGVSFHPSVSSFSSLKRRKMLMKGIYIIEESYLQNLLF